MLHDDFLLRQIRQFAMAVAGLRDQQDDESAEQDVDRLLNQLAGISLPTLDRLPGVAV